MADEVWLTAGRRTALTHPYITVYLDEIILPDGRRIPDWPIVDIRDYINVMVVNEEGLIMILEGYKHGIGRSSWQVVGGYLEPGEEALTAAKRELLEETGYQSDNWSFLGSFIVDANRRAGQGSFFLARDARQIVPPNHDDLEAFTIRWASAAETQAALGDGRVQGASYAIALSLGLLSLQQNARGNYASSFSSIQAGVRS